MLTEEILVARVLVYYILTFLFVLILGGTQQATRLPAEIGIPQLAPGIAALLMLLIFRSDRHRITLAFTSTPIKRYLAAFAIPITAGFFTFGISLLLARDFTGPSFQSVVLLPTLIWMPLGAIGEEIGWRGYLHKHLDRHTNGFTSSIIVGILWTFFHIHLVRNGIVFTFFTMLLFVSISLLMYIILRDQKFNVTLAAVFHLGINLTSLFFIDYIDSSWFIFVYSISWAVLAFSVVWLRKKVYFQSY